MPEWIMEAENLDDLLNKNGGQINGELVRCGDCMHYNGTDCTAFTSNPAYYLPMEEDDYCSCGERRREEWNWT